MSKNRLFINSIISLIVIGICLVLFMQNSNGSLNFESLLISISNGWIYLLLASILLIINVYIHE